MAAPGDQWVTGQETEIGLPQVGRQEKKSVPAPAVGDMPAPAPLQLEDAVRQQRPAATKIRFAIAVLERVQDAEVVQRREHALRLLSEFPTGRSCPEQLQALPVAEQDLAGHDRPVAQYLHQCAVLGAIADFPLRLDVGRAAEAVGQVRHVHLAIEPPNRFLVADDPVLETVLADLAQVLAPGRTAQLRQHALPALRQRQFLVHPGGGFQQSATRQQSVIGPGQIRGDEVDLVAIAPHPVFHLPGMQASMFLIDSVFVVEKSEHVRQVVARAEIERPEGCPGMLFDTGNQQRAGLAGRSRFPVFLPLPVEPLGPGAHARESARLPDHGGTDRRAWFGQRHARGTNQSGSLGMQSGSV